VAGIVPARDRGGAGRSESGDGASRARRPVGGLAPGPWAASCPARGRPRARPPPQVVDLPPPRSVIRRA